VQVISFKTEREPVEKTTASIPKTLPFSTHSEFSVATRAGLDVMLGLERFWTQKVACPRSGCAIGLLSGEKRRDDCP